MNYKFLRRKPRSIKNKDAEHPEVRETRPDFCEALTCGHSEAGGSSVTLVRHGFEKTGRLAWSRRDWILVLTLLLIALLSGLWYARPRPGGRVCYVVYGREVVMTVPLEKDAIFSIEPLPQVVLEVRNGRAAFIESDCRDQVCVHTGFISEHGQFSACLPNGIAIKIEGMDINAPDTIG